jgi:hypothetical protein
MPQPLKDIEERIELLKMTLGMFVPSEPGPVAVELLQLGEEIFEHALVAAGEVPTQGPADGVRLLALHAQWRRISSAVEPLDGTCRKLLEQYGWVMGEPDNPETGERLLAAVEAAGDLYSVVAAKLGRAGRSGMAT